MIELIKNNPTLIIAFYGAFLSTIAIIWNIYNSYQDRPKIKVKTSIGFFMSDTRKTFFFIKIINNGKRSIHLSSFGLRSGKEDLIPMRVTGLPCELKAGGSHNEFFEIDKLKNKQFNFAWYQDETGKLYKGKSIKKKLNNYFKRNKDKNSLMQKTFKRELVE
ncbi:MAG TPA: hypothetical protein VJJ23_05260 [Candidatus Nanoarchaeia archaeon]|nr:hypothetical protein [Candidatus Nanoarchaeia archaeon]